MSHIEAQEKYNLHAFHEKHGWRIFCAYRPQWKEENTLPPELAAALYDHKVKEKAKEIYYQGYSQESGFRLGLYIDALKFGAGPALLANFTAPHFDILSQEKAAALAVCIVGFAIAAGAKLFSWNKKAYNKYENQYARTGVVLYPGGSFTELAFHAHAPADKKDFYGAERLLEEMLEKQCGLYVSEALEKAPSRSQRVRQDIKHFFAQRCV
jgi:hypothetical protein